jgi:hypothetical protein
MNCGSAAGSYHHKTRIGIWSGKNMVDTRPFDRKLFSDAVIDLDTARQNAADD